MDGNPNREEAERCVELATAALHARDFEKADRLLRKSMKMCPNPAAESLLKTLERIKQAQTNTSQSNSSNTSSSSSSSQHSSSQSQWNGNGSKNTNHAYEQNDNKTHVNPNSTSSSSSSSSSSSHRPSSSSSSATSSPFSQKRSSSSSKSSASASASASTSGAASTGGKSGAGDFTSEQRELAKRIKSCKDYYEILGVTRTVSDGEIKKAYRKLAVQLHPDKNKAPEAEEAFKALTNAFQTLSDSQKRSFYDQYGEDENGRAQAAAQAQQQERYYQYTREEDITPEDIFNMFFMNGATGFHRRRVFRRRRGGGGDDEEQHAQNHQQQQHQATGAQPSLMQFAHFIPLFLLLLFSLLAAPTSDSLPYSLSKTGDYIVRRQTTKFQTEYYVDKTFEWRYQDPRARHQIEQQVEQANYIKVKEECKKQREEVVKQEKFAKKEQTAELKADAYAKLHDLKNNLSACAEREQTLYKRL